MKDYTFDAEKVRKDLVNWIREWVDSSGNNCNVVLGISGGKDSTVAAALCVEALGKDRVIGVMLPNGEQKDISDSIRICELLGIKNFTINIAPALTESFNRLKELGIEITSQCEQNMPARERTKMIRAVCQCFNGRMVNTCNLSEDYVGYFTVGGDGDGDFSPLGNLTKSEVVEIGRVLCLPKELIEKTPSDGLCGKTDEDNLGFTYEQLDQYIRTGDCDDKDAKVRIIKKNIDNLFKLQETPKFPYNSKK